jgi:Pectate lyase superfamily protein
MDCNGGQWNLGGDIMASRVATQFDMPLVDGANVKHFGAKGDGTTDDRAAIQAAISSRTGGCPVIFPPGTYKLNSTLALEKETSLLGWCQGVQDGIETQSTGCVIDASAINSSATIIAGNGNDINHRFENFRLKLAPANSVASSEFGGVVGINPGAFSNETKFRNLYIEAGTNGIVLDTVSRVTLDNVRTNLQRTHSVAAKASSSIVSINSLYANCGGVDTVGNPANFYLTQDCYDVEFFDPHHDEAFLTAPCLYIHSAHNVFVWGTRFFSGGYGVRIGADTSRVHLIGVSAVPFNPALPGPINTILIEGGTGHVLRDVVTDPNGGGDISDAGTATQWSNVNGIYKMPGIPTADPHVVGQLWSNSGVMTVSAG